jgi:hypothetical protein
MSPQILANVISLEGFKQWLERSGYGYLANGVGSMLIGDAILEIARRAGVRGLTGSDSILRTLPMIQDLIVLRCKPFRD